MERAKTRTKAPFCMRLGRFQAGADARIGRFEGETVVDITDAVDDFQAALADPEQAAEADGDTYSIDEITYLPPTTSQNAIFCAAVNYEAHAEEAGNVVPERPFIFLKLPRTLVGHDEPIAFHSSVTKEIDYEAELAAVIGTEARYVDADEALDYVAGYTMLNDISARDLQLELRAGDEVHLDWFSGKAMEQTTPIGPTIAVDEIDDPQSLAIKSRVNGETLQDDNTEMMVQSVADLVSHLSTRLTLHPGDVIATGTPEGVGIFKDIALQDGDVVEVEVEELGTLSNEVEERPAP